MDYQRLITENYIQICNILREAGKIILKYYIDDTFTTVLKSDQSPVTSADLAADQFITDSLLKMYPDLVVISEESDILTFEQRKHFEYFWMLDPLDGTKEFLNHTDEFTINLALIHDHEVVAGFIYLPAFEEMYYAIKGRGAFQVDSERNEKALNVSKFTLRDEGLRVLASRSHMDDRTKVYIDVLKNPKIISRGSALKFISIAKGEADYYPRMINIMEWDTAAGQIIIEEAGGSLVDATSRLKLTYNKPTLVNPFFIASGQII